MVPKIVFMLFMVSLMIQGAFSARLIFKNKCPYTVWPGIQHNPNVPQFRTTGFQIAPGGLYALDSTDSWAGRIWARTSCNEQFTCATGTCAPSLACDGAGGSPPTSLVEFTLNGDGGKDFYDISLVDGFNIPVGIKPSDGDCPSTTCSADINSVCPANLSVRGSDGRTIGCKSACIAFGEPQYCCTGEYNNPDRCKPTAYSRRFKTACPQAYSYPYDHKSSTFTCPTGAMYTITFCPASNLHAIE